MNPRVFVVMPFGKKEDIDFDAVYGTFISPPLIQQGYDVFRADSTKQSGSILVDMFQELLLADIVVADLTIDNPNVWYELGVRHALRANGAILLSAREKPMPFDVYTERKLRYRIGDGVPDPKFLESDQKEFTAMIKESSSAWHGKKASPVYNLLPFLEQPDWKSFRVGGVNELWEKQERWQSRVEVAHRKGHPGDILVLADETPIRPLTLDAYRAAAIALRELGDFSFALEQIEKALAIEPNDLASLREKGILLGRMEQFEEAREWLKNVARIHSEDAETCGLLGRVEKDSWFASWRHLNDTPQQRISAAADHIELLLEAVNAYTTGFRQEPSHYYSGINAVTLLHLARHLEQAEDAGQAKLRVAMEGGVRWAAQAALAKETNLKKDFWARVTLADLTLLIGDVSEVRKAYRYAAAAANKNWFALHSTFQQLIMLSELGFRPSHTEVAIKEMSVALAELHPPWRPQNVYLFSGHMVDAADREKERFPPDLTGDAAAAIGARLDALGVGENDLAMCQGACGGDLLFARAALDRGMRLSLYLPFDEARFLKNSVAFAGEEWTKRFYEVKENEKTLMRAMLDQLGPAPDDVNPYDRANLWLLYSALAWGPEKVHFVAFWNGEKSGKPGGTDHMIEAVQRRLGRIHVIDAADLLRKKRNQKPI